MYIYENVECDILNLSFGLNICENYRKLYDICNQLSQKGVIIVSSFDNKGSISYPAEFDTVIGVTNGTTCLTGNDFQYIHSDIINLCAKGGIQRVAWTYPEYLVTNGNSFACAHISAYVAKLMTIGIKSRLEILKAFKELSPVKLSLKEACTREEYKLFDINNAAIFPFNKEMHSLIRFSDLLPFKIVDVYDTKYSGNVGASVKHILNDNSISDDYTIKNINKIEWDSFDTIIIGHIDELSSIISNLNLRKQLIEKAIENNKNIYSFDSLNEYKNIVNNRVNSSKIYWPKVDKYDLPENRLGKLYIPSKPVLGILGTSSKQGKFTLQLTLRKKFLELGYKVGQIGSEPSSLLYSFDSVYPMGYNSSVYIKEFESITYLNNLINSIEKKDPDIIIVGSQSGTIPYYMGNIVQYPIAQINFILGTQPNAVILCVNPYDEVQYIKRTIEFVQSIIPTKVISLVIFPMELKEGWTSIYGEKQKISEEKYNKLKDDLSNVFNLPIYQLGNNIDMTSLANDIIEYFSE
jgi:uncharacterized NAD-dependent epimerase/dehydratase family protein